mmetsp:Transcript_12960/g.27496  ORF Transcript_12960/g.27496 Transcript_12960/m.27496 type:complete len:273 (-) Transcript_12960:37-855(-)
MARFSTSQNHFLFVRWEFQCGKNSTQFVIAPHHSLDGVVCDVLSTQSILIHIFNKPMPLCTTKTAITTNHARPQFQTTKQRHRQSGRNPRNIPPLPLLRHRRRTGMETQRLRSTLLPRHCHLSRMFVRRTRLLPLVDQDIGRCAPRRRPTRQSPVLEKSHGPATTPHGFFRGHRRSRHGGGVGAIATVEVVADAQFGGGERGVCDCHVCRVGVLWGVSIEVGCHFRVLTGVQIRMESVGKTRVCKYYCALIVNSDDHTSPAITTDFHQYCKK